MLEGGIQKQNCFALMGFGARPGWITDPNRIPSVSMDGMEIGCDSNPTWTIQRVIDLANDSSKNYDGNHHHFTARFFSQI
jgi:hypothetical protein